MKHNSKLLNQPASALYEAEVTEGLEFITESELTKTGAQIAYQNRGEVGFRFTGKLQTLLSLTTVQSVYRVQSFPVPRPRGLLDNTYFRQILTLINEIIAVSGHAAFQSLYVAAAGSDSSVMMRIKTSLAQELGLTIADEKGDLWIRVRPGREGGWQVLIRLSPRPLVTRAWRRCNLEGALNAATAQAMIRLTQPAPEDTFINLGCGSGTLLIERQALGRSRLCIGFDLDADHLSCAKTNVDASGYKDRITLQRADMAHLPFSDGAATALCADLPFGQLTGSHANNQVLYPHVLREAARIARSGARFVLITHEIHLMDKLLSQDANWSLEQTIQVNLRGLHPRIYVLKRQTAT